MMAAKSAGMKCIVSPSEFATKHDLSEADLVVKDWNGPPRISVQLIKGLID